MEGHLTTFLEGLKELSIELTETQVEQFKTYYGEVALFNRRLKLVGAEGVDFVIKHLLDSLTPLHLFKEIITKNSTLCDAGSGAGLPGIPLAIALPEYPFTLLERSGRRAGFLRNAVAMTQIASHVEVLEQDIDVVTQQFDIVTFRAFLPLEKVINQLNRILKPGGTIGAYKGKRELLEEELAPLSDSWESQIIELKVPFLESERTFCLLKRRGE
ncbi:MAG: 16S rRNA (guanine(527)-N(7))-methyltransferase RsmG [Spirochaetales bacterium]|jgi:16S rRNA (guanine527-N7)-methyltransferase|nr:16S rRNA (guanine(527)-N(7))-methyltransferase RsmG [Spirochaetales bacterium]